MHTVSLNRWLRDHTFGQDRTKPGERRMWFVIALTAVTMVVEIVAGIAFGSMALLADGLHMGSHAAALAISAFAYFYTRRHARNRRYTFGTGKVGSLAGFGSAILLLVLALTMAVESVRRFFSPVEIEFSQAILVAVLGLIVNGVSLAILRGHGDGHVHREGEDHSLVSAYMHVLADALTSVLAIVALLLGKHLGWWWMDPASGLLGAGLVTVWAIRLIRLSSCVLLDVEAPSGVNRAIKRALEARDSVRVADLHVWTIGPGILAAEVTLVTQRPRDPECYVRLIPRSLGVVHATIQVHRCRSRGRRP